MNSPDRVTGTDRAAAAYARLVPVEYGNTASQLAADLYMWHRHFYNRELTAEEFLRDVAIQINDAGESWDIPTPF